MKGLSGITVAILAGGLGTRLRSVVTSRPKALAPVAGRSFLVYLLDQLSGAGLKRVVLCTGHLGEQIRTALGESYGRMQLAYSAETEPLGTGGALKLALPLLHSDPVLVVNGDSFCRIDLLALHSWHFVQKAAVATLALTWVLDVSRYGKVQVDKQGHLLKFEEKNDSGGPGWINAGIYLLNRSFIEAIPPGRFVSLERDVFPSKIGWGLYGYCTNGEFVDIGTPESYAAAAEFFSKRHE